ncbi:MAG: Starch-binding associating with outer rane [Bacteroidota bacterium]|nr:Starch-binding associating with outer rane [Bacteroidota bacterium]
MKNLKIIFAALVLLSISSCSKYLDTNTDPNKSQKSRVDLVLTSAEVNIAYGIGERHTNQMLVWNQYWTGDQSVITNDWDKNDMSPGDGSVPWNTLYSQSLTSLKYLIDQGVDAKYAGVAKILMAYEYQVLVDLYGDVPFTEALKGSDATPNRAPAVDDDAAIYPQLLTMIDDGLALVATPLSAAVHHVDGDLIFGGDDDEWTRFGNSLKLRILMRQTNTGDATIATQVGNLVSTIGGATGFEFTTKKYAGVEFLSAASAALNANPLWTELEGGALKNYYYASATAIDYLKGTRDPRIDFQYTPPQTGDSAGIHVGLAQGDQQDIPLGLTYSRPKGGKYDPGGDAKLYGPNVPFILISNWEIDFFLAEAAARGWIPDDAQTLYNTAVQTNFDYFGAGDASGFLATGSAAAGTGGMYDMTSLNSQLKSIALQKWVSMNGIQATESWTETRRMDNTSNPIFQSPGGIFVEPNQTVMPGSYPSIMYYSEQEVSINPNIHQHALTDKVFWDK